MNRLSSNLLIDIGNTSLKWALWDGTRLGEMQAARHEGGLPLDVLAAWDELEGVNQLVLSSVGPRSVVEAIERVAQARWGSGAGSHDVSIREVCSQAEAGAVRIAYDQPSRLGVDRFLALIGAHQLFPGPKLILDAGTAATFDLLLGNGQHLGGLILPGLRMMRDSLLSGTQIPRYEPLEADAWYAADTGEAIAAGSLQALAATAERLLGRLGALASEQGGEGAAVAPALILTGGDADRLRPVLDVETHWVPDVVLRGLSRFV